MGTAALGEAHAAAIVGYVVSGFFLSQAYAPYLYFVVGMVIGLDISARHAWALEDDDADVELDAGAEAYPPNLPIHGVFAAD